MLHFLVKVYEIELSQSLLAKPKLLLIIQTNHYFLDVFPLFGTKTKIFRAQSLMSCFSDQSFYITADKIPEILLL